jgi:polyribonucleotide nucleotidyltransferase
LAGDDFVEEVIDVHRSKHGRIIGKGGSKMKQVQSESGAHVTIPKQTLNSDKITLKGRREAVDKAKQLILDLVKGDGESEGGDESKMSTKLQVPKDKHRLIIGRGGATVNEIRDECNVEIVIPPANSRDEDIVIKGDNPDNITQAIKKIQEITGSARNNPIGGGGAGAGYGRRGSNGNNGNNGNNFPSFREGGRSTPEGGNRRGGTPEGGSRGGRGGRSG